MIEVRAATRDDLPQLAELMQEHLLYQQQVSNNYFQLDPQVDWPRYIEGLLGSATTGILVAARDGRLLGFAHLQVLRPARRPVPQGLRGILYTLLRRGRPGPPSVFQPRSMGVVQGVYVRPYARDGRAARSLFRASVEWFKERGVTELEALVWAKNEPVLKMARRAGFEVISLRVRKKL